MPKKERIPSTVRNTVWLKHIEDKNNAKCFCCKLEKITNANWHCGHIVSEKNGGKVHIDNLRPICAGCNCSMGTTNMFDFMKKYGFDTITSTKNPKKKKKKLSEKQLNHLKKMREKAKEKREGKKREKEIKASTKKTVKQEFDKEAKNKEVYNKLMGSCNAMWNAEKSINDRINRNGGRYF